MEITIKIDRRLVTVEVSTEVADYLEQASHNGRTLNRERQRYWDGRGYDEYIITAEGRLPYCATPEDIICQRETLNEIMAVLALCTEKQQERFLLHALYDLSYTDVATLCGCSKGAVEKSIAAVKNIFKKFWKGGIR